MAQKEATLLLRVKQVGQQVMDRFVITLGDLINVARQIPQFVANAISAYREEEQAINALNQSMINQGVYSDDLKNKYLQLASSIQKTTLFADEQVISAQAVLQGFVGQREVTEDLIKATLNLAAAKKMDLTTAANLVGKAITGNTTVFQRHGVYIEDAIDKEGRLANVTRTLNSVFYGQAEAAAQGAGGFSKLANTFSDFMEAIGGRLTTVLLPLANILGDIVESATELIGVNQKNAASMDPLVAKVQAARTEYAKLAQKVYEVQNSAQASSVDKLIFSEEKLQKERANLRLLEEELRKHEETKIEIAANTKALNNAQEEQEKIEREAKLFEKLTLEQELEMAHTAWLNSNNENRLSNHLNYLNKAIAAETDFQKKKDFLEQKGVVQRKMLLEQENKEKLQGYSTFFSGLSALTESSNKQIAAIGKAAAIANATMNAYVAIQNALANVPYPANIAAAIGIGVQAFANVAKISGVQLAEGGIVMPTPGGTQATIGEGDRAEAVIPLPKNFDPDSGLGGGMTINFNGPILGDESQARRFAEVLDKELYKLRKEGGSLSFEGII